MRSGIILIEALVAASILSLVLASAIGAFLLTIRTSLGNGADVQAAFLAEEGLEAMRILRDNSWSGNIASQTSGDFYLAFDGTTWQATSINTYIDNAFERSITIFDVQRDGNGDIVTQGGAIDVDTKKVMVNVSWRTQSGTSTYSLSTYLTNMFDN